MKDTDELKASVERKALLELHNEWENINYNLFGDALDPPVMLLGDAATVLGAWRRETRELEISRRIVWDMPWTAVIEILKHETAHQYVDEILGVTDETAHGPTFRRVCAERGIDAKRGMDSGPPPGNVSGVPENRRIAARISALLALAGSANRHEAQAAMNAAQRLMLKHNVEADRFTRRSGYTFCHLGEPTGRVPESHRTLAYILSRFFFVKAIWIPVYRPRTGKRGTVLEICGEPHNLEIAAFVHGFLIETAERLWKRHKEKHHITSNRDRLRFHAGVMSGFQQKLDQQEKKHQEQGLVWVGDGGLQAYYRSRYPRITTTHGRQKKIHAAFASGREAGKGIILHRTIHDSRKSGRFLGPPE